MASATQGLRIAQSDHPLELLPAMTNRHGLIAGATGTGKTVTLRVIAEQLSAIGVPVFLADVKGDLSGIAFPGGESAKIRERAQQLGVTDLQPAGCPTVFWDVFGDRGHPVRATVSEMGPLLFGRLLALNETQGGVLSIVFKIADDDGLLLLDLKDLRALLDDVGQRAKELRTRYGNISAASVGAIQRALLTLEQQGGEHFLGEPALKLADLMRTDGDGRGVVNILVADRLVQSPQLYSTFLLWLLAELFEELPEVGDVAQPKLVFFFDEAHLLFDGAPKVLMEEIERVVRLIRSKGVGVYFITQSPLDVPDTVLGQLGNRVQHALRAFTPKDQKAVRAAGETFRANPHLDVVRALTELGVGEALVSFLDERGVPAMVERAFICPPRSRLTPLSDEERTRLVRASPLAGRYDQVVDRESAYEMLHARAAGQKSAEKSPTASAGAEASDVLATLAKSAARAAGSQLGRQLGRQVMRGVLGAIFGNSRRR